MFASGGSLPPEAARCSGLCGGGAFLLLSYKIYVYIVLFSMFSDIVKSFFNVNLD